MTIQKNYQLIFVFIIAFVSVHVIHTMEQPKNILCYDNEIITIPDDLLPMMPGLEGIYSSTFINGESTLKASFAKKTIQHVFDCLQIIKQKFMTRNQLLQDKNKPLLDDKLGNQYIPLYVQATIEDSLNNISHEEFIDTMHAADFLDAFCLTNACVFKWLQQFVSRMYWDDKRTKYMYFTYDYLKELAEKEGILETIIDTYIDKYWSSSIYGINFELNIADLLALDQISVTEVASSPKSYFLSVHESHLTNLDGLKHVPHIDEIFQLNLEKNHLITIKAHDLSCLTNVSTLMLSYNPLRYINPKAFEKLPKLKHLWLLRTELDFKNIMSIKKAIPHVQVQH